MKRTMLTLGAAASALTLSVSQPALAQEPRGEAPRYEGRVDYTECRKSSGSTGLAVGGVGGGLVGAAVSGGGLLGILLGAVGGAVAGRAIDRNSSKAKRCRPVRAEESYESYDDRPAVTEPGPARGDLHEDGPSER